MEPKLKAKDLVNKFKTYADDNYADDKNPYYGQVLANKRIVLHNSAKQCALIAVDEIDDIYQKLTPKDDPYYFLLELEYWQQVKQEIELL